MWKMHGTPILITLELASRSALSLQNCSSMLGEGPHKLQPFDI
jgi:hypothetical protein